MCKPTVQPTGWTALSPVHTVYLIPVEHSPGKPRTVFHPRGTPELFFTPGVPHGTFTLCPNYTGLHDSRIPRPALTPTPEQGWLSPGYGHLPGQTEGEAFIV